MLSIIIDIVGEMTAMWLEVVPKIEMKYTFSIIFSSIENSLDSVIFA